MTTNDPLWIAHQCLTDLYGTQEIYGRSDPMHELIATILSHRTTHANEVAAFKSMRARFPSWEAVRDAPLDELIACIQTANYPEVKAPWIKQVLTAIITERGEATIDFLADMSTEEAMAWLTSLPGVGLKTASLLLLFYFRKPVLPVDTHVHRVTQRVGVLEPKVSAERAHKLLLEQLPKTQKCCSIFTNISIGTVSAYVPGTTPNVMNAYCPVNAFIFSQEERWS